MKLNTTKLTALEKGIITYVCTLVSCMLFGILAMLVTVLHWWTILLFVWIIAVAVGVWSFLK